MNNKDIFLYKVIDAVIDCCATDVDDKGTKSITKEDVLGKSRCENVVMTRCILITQLLCAGYSVTTVAKLLNRTEPGIRHLQKLNLSYLHNSRAYRIATAEATLACRDIEDTSK